MVRYLFREDEPLRIKAANQADPTVFGEALAEITQRHAGRLTPRALVDAASDVRHPLHKHFEWDDTIAADAYRLDQARSIIRVVRVTDSDAREGTTRAFQSVNEGGGIAYREIGEIKTSLELSLAVLNRAERDLEAFERRYRDLVDVCDIVRAAREKLKARRDKLETRSTVDA